MEAEGGGEKAEADACCETRVDRAEAELCEEGLRLWPIDDVFEEEGLGGV